MHESATIHKLYSYKYVSKCTLVSVNYSGQYHYEVLKFVTASLGTANTATNCFLDGVCCICKVSFTLCF